MRSSFTLTTYSFILNLPILPLYRDRELLNRPQQPVVTNINRFLKKKNISVNTNFTTTELKRYLGASKPVTLFYGNHRHLFDPLIVISALKLSKVKIIAALSVAWIFQAGKDQVISVSIRTLAKDWDINSIGRKLAILTEGLNRTQSDRLNKQVPTKVVRAITKQENIIIFPDGGLQHRTWFNGIGFILYDAWVAGQTQLNLQPFSLQGNGNKKFLKHNFRLLLHRPKRLEISFALGKPLSLAKLSHEIDFQKGLRKEIAKKITTYLEAIYHSEFSQTN